MNPTDELLVFTQETCPKCEEAKKKLNDIGLKYREIRVDTVEGRAEFALHISKTNATPAFFYKGVEYDKLEDILSQQGQ